MYRKGLIITIFLTLVSAVLSVDIPCNQRSIDRLDDTVMKLARFGDPNRDFPGDMKDVLSNCQVDNQLISWGKNYTKMCMVSREVETSRHVTNLLMFSIKKVVNKRCRSEATRNTFIKTGKCGNYAKSDTIKCYNQYTLHTQQINKAKKIIIKNDKHLVPLLCCSYHKFHDCCVEAWEQKTRGAPPCTRKASVELESYVNDSMYDILQYLCGDYQENNDKCDKLIERYKEVFNTIKISNLPTSPLSGSNDIFDSIPPL